MEGSSLRSAQYTVMETVRMVHQENLTPEIPALDESLRKLLDTMQVSSEDCEKIWPQVEAATCFTIKWRYHPKIWQIAKHTPACKSEQHRDNFNLHVYRDKSDDYHFMQGPSPMSEWQLIWPEEKDS